MKQWKNCQVKKNKKQTNNLLIKTLIEMNKKRKKQPKISLKIFNSLVINLSIITGRMTFI